MRSGAMCTRGAQDVGASVGKGDSLKQRSIDMYRSLQVDACAAGKKSVALPVIESYRLDSNMGSCAKFPGLSRYAAMTCSYAKYSYGYKLALVLQNGIM